MEYISSFSHRIIQRALRSQRVIKEAYGHHILWRGGVGGWQAAFERADEASG